jgi:hypothetical protein
MPFVDAEDIRKEVKEPGLVRVAVCIPNEGHAPVEAYANRLSNFMHLGKLEERGKHLKENPRFEFFFVTLGRIFTPLAREEAAKFAEEMNADYLYMIDDDMTCPDDLFELLYRHNVDVVAPLAFTRNFPHKAVLYEIKEGWDPVSHSQYFINHHIDVYKKDSLIECDAVGFGAALINMRVIRAMKGQRFMDGCTSGTGEDILFCHKARKLGFRVFMDTSTKLGHLSHPIEVTEDYVERVRKEFKYQERQPVHSTKEARVILGEW